jgi:polyhydroxybutyrate depolymerase
LVGLPLSWVKRRECLVAGAYLASLADLGCERGCAGRRNEITAVDGAAKVLASTVVRSRGCGARPADLSSRSITVDVGGLNRTYYLALPAHYDPSAPLALVLGFHGSGSNGEAIRAHLGLEAPSGGGGIFAYPDGLAVSGGGSGWFLTKEGRDVAFVDKLVADVEATYCVNQNALFAAGFSYGGWMVNALACARPGLLRGIASIAGGGPTNDCPSGVAALIIHGADDANEPLHVGEASRDFWLHADGCARRAPSTFGGTCQMYAGCPEDKPVLWCRHDRGHEVPDFARATVWDFFARLR